jgi:hypothetical protein
MSIDRHRAIKDASLTKEAVYSVWSVPEGYKKPQLEDITAYRTVGGSVSGASLPGCDLVS